MRIYEIEDQSSKTQDCELIKQHCGPYLSAIGGLANALKHYALYRGLNFIIPDDDRIITSPVRQDRQPLDTPAKVHVKIDDWFEANLPSKIRYRSSSVFCVGREVVAKTYAVARDSNAIAVVIPIGEFHYCWSPIFKDLYRQLYLYKADYTGIDQLLTDGKYKEDVDLDDAARSGHEVMIYCNQVLLIRQDRARELYWAL